MLRKSGLIASFALLAIVAPACMAAQFHFANGDFKLSVPDGWNRILQSPGDPETMVFQVPDPSPSAKDATARVTVTTEHVLTLIGFKEFVIDNSNRAQALSHYTPDKLRSTSTTLYYTATDGAIQQTYVEHYFFDHGYAVLVRCVRPSNDQAGAAWTAAFDKGCARIAASVPH